MDLASLSSVQSAASQFLASSYRLDVLINNAGIMAVPDAVTEDGYEIQFGTNHLGHALLTKLLLPSLTATSKLPATDVRIVTLSSSAHGVSTPNGGIQFPLLQTSQIEDGRVAKYGQSKLANILHSKELARRFPEFTCVAVHPGMVSTGLSQGMQDRWVLRVLGGVVEAIIGVDAHEGAYNQLWAATSEGVVSGCYYVPVGKKNDGSAYARDEVLAGKLWEWTETELKKYGP
jgi:retinol dehydrogenase-12